MIDENSLRERWERRYGPLPDIDPVEFEEFHRVMHQGMGIDQSTWEDKDATLKFIGIYLSEEEIKLFQEHSIHCLSAQPLTKKIAGLTWQEGFRRGARDVIVQARAVGPSQDLCECCRQGFEVSRKHALEVNLSAYKLRCRRIMELLEGTPEGHLEAIQQRWTSEVQPQSHECR